MPAITATADMGLMIVPQARTAATPSTWRSDVADNDDLSPAKGIILCSVVGLAIWAPVIGYFFG
jgi:hypothetical protein